MNLKHLSVTILVLAAALSPALADTLIYSQDFSAADPPGWTVVNSGAGNAWSLTSNLAPYSGTHHMQYQWHQQFPADTWAFTPGISLTAGYSYHVEFYQRVMSPFYPECLQVTVGPAPDPAAQTIVLLDLPGMDNFDYLNRVTAGFVSAAGGTYYFGFHCCSAADMYYLCVDLVRVYEYESSALILDFPYTLDFEDGLFPPEGWNVIDGDTGAINWARNGNFIFAHGGTGSAWHNYSSVPPGGQAGWLISPSVGVPAAGNYFFSFWTFNLLPDRMVYNGLKVNTSPDPADPGWVELWTQDDARARWKQVAVNISAFAGQTVYFAFLYQGYNADAWFIDDIRIAEVPTDNLPPVISLLPLLNTPLADEYDDYVVSAEIEDAPFFGNPLGGAELSYSLDGGASWETPVPLVPGTPPEWTAAIPAQELGTTVTYSLSADDILENNGWSEVCEFSVMDPTWLRYDQGGTVYLGYTATSFGTAVLFANPFWGTGIPLRILAVDACSYFSATANLHIYGWDGVSWATLVDLIPGAPPLCAFSAETIGEFEVEAYVNTPWFLVSFEGFAPGNYLVFDHRYDYGTTFAKVGGQYYRLSNPGSWRIGAQVSGAVQNLAIAPVGGVPTLNWDEYPGASGYNIYFLPYGPPIWPYDEPWYWLEDGWALSYYPYTGPEPRGFFYVTADFPDPVRADRPALTTNLPPAESLETLPQAPYIGFPPARE